MRRTRSAVAASHAVYAAAKSEQLTLLAAAIAYYAFVSMIPLVLVALAVASVVGGPTLIGSVTSLVDGVLTPETATVLESALASGDGRQGATLIGLAVLAWSGLRVFRGIDAAFSRIYGIDRPEPLPAQLRDASLVLGSIAVTAVVATWLAAAIPRVAPGAAVVLGPLTSAVVLPIALYPLYYVFPDSNVSAREAVPGAVFAGAGWTVLVWLFAVYTAHAGAFQFYGFVGAVLLALTWFYAAALLVLLGAVVNVVLADRVTDRQLQQERLREVANGNP